MTNLTKKIATAWRSFLSSEEGFDGLRYILEQRPHLTPEDWQKAAGFEEFHRRIQDILDYESARNSGSDAGEDNLKS